MSKKIFKAFEIAVAMTVGAIGVGSLIPTTLPAAQGAPAVLVLDVACGLVLDASGNLYPAPEPATEIRTQSDQGTETYICKVDNVPNPTGKAVKFTPEDNPYGELLSCQDSQGRETRQFVEVISASGQATLQCHFKN
jgi:hypothetical protein